MHYSHTNMPGQRKAGKLNPLSHWIISHRRACRYALHELIQAPFATLLTLAVIGIAMALPSCLYVFLKNAQSLSHHINGTPTISLYLNSDSNAVNVKLLQQQLTNNKKIKKQRYISPEEGLKTFKKITHFDAALAELTTNPLPGVIVVTPSSNIESPAELQTLATELKNFQSVASAQVDITWVKRLYYIVTLGKRITYALAVLFSFGVLLIVGNTIRLTLQKHQAEISILKLIGARAAFIRRPLLYRGFFYGSLGGYIAWILLTLIVLWLQGPATALAQSYGSSITLTTLGWKTSLGMIAACALLGWLGAWLTLQRHLQAPDS